MIEDERERLKISDVYKEYRHICLHIAMGITHDQQMVEDAVQDAFVEVIRRKEKIFSLSCNHLQSYLVIIVKHKAIDILRKYQKISDIDDSADILGSDETPVDEQIIDKMGFEHLVSLVSKLDEKYKVVFEMKYILGFSNKEIAKMMNIERENVKIRIYRAKVQLRKLLGNEVTVNV
ncbi:MAG: sigma-70 family RNA polymerase sigma factor [Oscillospiraceae bacterium]|nr:sigma-70 family RNA polymerase sigma factor [Oscillospiraceae bacterium]